MTMTLRPDVSGNSAAIQLNGVDKLLLNADSTISGTASPDVTDNGFKLATTGFVQSRVSDLGGARNRIINGDCRIQQRPSLALPNGTAGYGGPDRWYATNAQGGGQFTQSAGTIFDGAVPKPCVAHTVNNVATDLTTNKYWTGFVQFIEGYNVWDLLGQPVVISFLFRSNVAGTYSVALRDANPATYSYVSTFTVLANTTTRVVINVPAVPTAATIPNTNAVGMQLWVGSQQVSAGTFATSTLNAWQAGNFITSNNATLWSIVPGASIAMTDVQIEAGSNVTPFERRNIDVEMSMCQRYFQQGNAFVAGYNLTGQYVTTWVQYRTGMRDTPTVTVSPNGLSNATTVASFSNTYNGVALGASVTATGAMSAGIIWTANAEL